MQRLLLRFAALATTVPVVYGGIISTRTFVPPPSLVTSAALQSSVPIAFDFATQSKAIVTLDGITLPTHAAIPASDALPDPILCSQSCPVCDVLPTNGRMPTELKPPISDVSRRNLTTPADHNNDIGRFLLAEYAFAEFVPLIPRRLPGTSSAFGRKLVRNKYNAAVGGLHGCTSVIVVSQSAIWLSHFWEVPSFRGPGTREVDTPRTDRERARFENEVLYEMENGGLRIPGLRQFTAEGGDFSATEDPRWIIVTPRIVDGFEGQLQHGTEVISIKRVLGKLFPKVPSVVIGYNRHTSREVQSTSVAGKLLVQYDPFQDVLQTPTSPCEIHQQAMVRLWVQDGPRPVFEKTWKAKSGQLIPGDWRNPTCSLPSNLPQARRARTAPNLTPGPAPGVDSILGSLVLDDPRKLVAGFH